MPRSLLEDAFAHHTWATLRLLDACDGLNAEQLETALPGTYGSIIDTLRHVIGGDLCYLHYLTGEGECDAPEGADLSSLRAIAEDTGSRWHTFVSRNPDPDAVVTEVDPTDGYRREASIGIRLAQALCHGTDHRSQICTALTSLGRTPPNIDVWDFGVATGSITETYPSGEK